MQFGLTIPLIKHLKVKNISYGEEIDLIFCWELHYLHINKQDILIAVNANNRFSIILAGMNSSDWNRYPKRLEKAIYSAFLDIGCTKVEIALYFKLANSTEITKTHGRRPVAYLNKMVETLYQYRDEINTKTLYQTFLMDIINTTPCHATGFLKTGVAKDFLLSDLKRIGIKK